MESVPRGRTTQASGLSTDGVGAVSDLDIDRLVRIVEQRKSHAEQNAMGPRATSHSWRYISLTADAKAKRYFRSQYRQRIEWSVCRWNSGSGDVLR